MLTLVPPPLTAADYDAIEAAVMETSRGRWFLAEFARRNRNADTEMLLAAIRRPEKANDADSCAPVPAADVNPIAPLVRWSTILCWRAPAKPAVICRDKIQGEDPPLRQSVLDHVGPELFDRRVA